MLFAHVCKYCNVTATTDVDELSLAVELSADSDDVSDDVTPTRSRGPSRDLDHVTDGRGGYRGALPSNNIQLMLTSADEESDDGESSYRYTLVISIQTSNLHIMHTCPESCK